MFYTRTNNFCFHFIKGDRTSVVPEPEPSYPEPTPTSTTKQSVSNSSMEYSKTLFLLFNSSVIRFEKNADFYGQLIIHIPH